MKNAKKGFTLIELIAVIAIIGILAAIIIPNIIGYTKKAKISKAVSDAKTIVGAVDAWNAEQDGTSAFIATGDNNLPSNKNIISSTATTKTWPTEFTTNVKNYSQLTIIEDSKLYQDTLSGTGHWTIDNGGTVSTN